MRILAIETSCDETACAVVEDGTKILSNVVASSAAMHEKYGGIVPEMAAREQLKCIIPVITEALSGSDLENPKGLTPLRTVVNKTIDAIAVTIGPGLIGSLLVGVETAKTIAFVTGKPLIPINHVIAHVYANFVRGDKRQGTGDKQTIEFPAISLVVSGGHTELYLMESMKQLKWLGGTLDDAAGEAFDKTARLLGFGSRGGLAIQEAASRSEIPLRGTLKFRVQSSKFRVIFPRPMIGDKSLNFSFSGLKTAVLREWKKYFPEARSGLTPSVDEAVVNAFAYEIQEAITDVLVEKTLRASRQHNVKSILLSGGVAANALLREKFRVKSSEFSVFVPPPPLCTDNAVYIAACAYFLGKRTDWKNVVAAPDLSVEGRFS